VAAAVLAFNWAISAYKSQVKRGRKKRQPKCRIFSFNHRGSSWCSRPRFFFYSLFPFDSDDDQNSYSIPVSVESFYSCWQRFVWGKTWQLLFKRFMQENCRLSLMDANFYGVDGGRKDNSTINTSYQKIFILWELRPNCLWHTFGLGQ